MDAQQLSHQIYKLLEQTDLQIIEMLKSADAATLNELMDIVPSFVQSAVQHCIDELPNEPHTVIETVYYTNIETDEEIEIITTYTKFDWDYENDTLYSAEGGTMEFVGIDANDYDPLDWEEIDVDYELKY